MKKGIFITLAIILGVFAVATIGGSFYMLDYSLAPDAQRTDTAACFRQLVEDHPEVKPWLDSLKNAKPCATHLSPCPRANATMPTMSAATVVSR